MKCSYKKRISNLLCAGVIVTGNILPLTTTAYAAEAVPATVSEPAPAITTLFLAGESAPQYTQLKGSKQTAATFAPPTANEQGEFPSLEDYISKLICAGCGKRCPLTAPQCGVGVTQYDKAVATYNNTNASSGALTESASSQAEQPAAEESSSTAVILEQSQVTDEAAGGQETAISSSQEETSAQPYTVAAADENVIDFVSTAAEEAQGTSDPFATAMEFAPLGGLMFGGVYYTIIAPKNKK